jgi:hypothetical protein
MSYSLTGQLFTAIWDSADGEEVAHVTAFQGIASTIIDLTGATGRRVPDNLPPGRRLRVSPASPTARSEKLQARGPDTNQRSCKAALKHPCCAQTLTRPARTLTTWP